MQKHFLSKAGGYTLNICLLINTYYHHREKVRLKNSYLCLKPLLFPDFFFLISRLKLELNSTNFLPGLFLKLYPCEVRKKVFVTVSCSNFTKNSTPVNFFCEMNFVKILRTAILRKSCRKPPLNRKKHLFTSAL